MAALLWIIAALAFGCLVAGVAQALGDPEAAGIDRRLTEACCIAAFGICLGSMVLV